MPYNSFADLKKDATVKLETVRTLKAAARLTPYALYTGWQQEQETLPLLLVGKTYIDTYGKKVVGTGAKLVGQGQLACSGTKIGLSLTKGERTAANKALQLLLKKWQAGLTATFVNGDAPSVEEQDETEGVSDMMRAAEEEAEKLDKAWKKLAEELEDAQEWANTARARATAVTLEGWGEVDTELAEAGRIVDARERRKAKAALEIVRTSVPMKLAELERRDHAERKRLAKFAKERNVQEPPSFTNAVEVAKEGAIYVFLDPHQNKHQHSDSMIPQLGAWKSKKGSLFASGKGLDWHEANTAQTMLAWAKTLDLSNGQKVILKKEPQEDTYIYDASAERDGDYVVVLYHCNPKASE